MIIRNKNNGFGEGYTPVVEEAENTSSTSMLLNFGILQLGTKISTYTSSSSFERAFLLIRGDAELRWRHRERQFSERVQRKEPLGEEAVVLHVPAGDEVTVVSNTAELAIQEVVNQQEFEPRLLRGGDYPSQLFGEGTMQETSTRRVRTVFDAATAPYSHMVIGEVVNYPGKWSSYPPHTHPQPEIYHFRFFPSHGFGYSEQGEEVYKIYNRDTALIPPRVTHPQTAAPGYALYYIWGIPHLPNYTFGPDSRIFKREHRWLTAADAQIWPDAPVDTLL